MTQTLRKYYTLEEYFTLEEKSLYRHEYYRGEIYQMAGAKLNHNRVVRNSTMAFDQAFGDRECEAFGSDQRVEIKTQDGSFTTYPDVSVVCGPLEYTEGRDDTITNSVLIIEVLSPGTATYDRTTKFYLYQNLASLQDYILSSQDRVYVEHYRKVEDGWLLRRYHDLKEELELVNLGINIPIEQLYRKVQLKPARVRLRSVKLGPKV